MSFLQLRAFHAVADNRGFTRAAEALNVTQPTLSGQVRGLEDTYGVRLFERRGRGVELTPIGERLFAVTQRLMDDQAEALRLLTAARGLHTGVLRVGADAPYHVIPLLAAFSGDHPGIQLSLSFGNSVEVLERLFERRCDVAVLPAVPSDRRLHVIPFQRERIGVFVERNHPWARRKAVAMADLTDQPLVLREKGSVTRAIFERALAEAKVRPGPSLEVGSREAVREAVAAGFGVGAVFESEFGNDRRLHLLRVKGGTLETTEYAVCRQDRRTAPVVRAFLDLVPGLVPGLGDAGDRLPGTE